jgi:GntR family transcriptional regulator, transcriptional repressor for pyruvate dehydrogenase complex
VRENMADLTAVRLRDWILQQALATGDKLPPESTLAPKLGVSRTVLREAVARLRAQGELTGRRGAGVFVAKPPGHMLEIATDDRHAVPDIIANLEIRVALEVEAAGLAARRRQASHIDAMREAMAAQADADTRESASAADFAFHRAVAMATTNHRFVNLLDQMGVDAIPRNRLRLRAEDGTDGTAYAAQLLDEHRAILEAIVAQDSAYARDAMRLHLLGSIQRYQQAVDAA